MDTISTIQKSKALPVYCCNKPLNKQERVQNKGVRLKVLAQ